MSSKLFVGHYLAVTGVAFPMTWGAKNAEEVRRKFIGSVTPIIDLYEVKDKVDQVRWIEIFRDRLKSVPADQTSLSFSLAYAINELKKAFN